MDVAPHAYPLCTANTRDSDSEGMDEDDEEVIFELSSSMSARSSTLRAGVYSLTAAVLDDNMISAAVALGNIPARINAAITDAVRERCQQPASPLSRHELVRLFAALREMLGPLQNQLRHQYVIPRTITFIPPKIKASSRWYWVSQGRQTGVFQGWCVYIGSSRLRTQSLSGTLFRHWLLVCRMRCSLLRRLSMWPRRSI
jgi:hypothetical protein